MLTKSKFSSSHRSTAVGAVLFVAIVLGVGVGNPAYAFAGPVPDTPENRARYGGPRSRAGRRSSPDGR